MKSKTQQKFVRWKHGVIYHIYPQSFKDTNGDGIGDLEGIIEKLDYLEKLGVHAIWLSPIYESPLVDAGYDISDYKSINAIYGTMTDFNRLLKLAHQRNIKIIMDLVLNHTSDLHPWFLESRSSKTNPKRDWYIWKPPAKKGKRPNNWHTNFGQPAWTLDHETNEYYYHSFFKEQPDLNWRNPDVKKQMFNVIRFWLDLGVDGFRLDVINLIFKRKDLKNNPKICFPSNQNVYNRNQPEVYDFLMEFRSLLNQYQNKVSIGEIYTPPPGNPSLVSSYLGNGTNMLHLAFDFSLMFIRWNATAYYKAINNYYTSLPKEGWPCFVTSNHDLGRSIKRWLFNTYKYKKAKLLAVLQFTLKGTPFIYYGDEIGMENMNNIPKEQIKDGYGKMFYPIYKGRDGARTPMQWNGERYAGFSSVSPWLPIHHNYQVINVEAELKDNHSMISLYQKLIQLRNEYPILQYGEIRFVNKGNSNILTYERSSDTEHLIIYLNFSSKNKRVYVSELADYEFILSLYNTRDSFNDKITLEPFQAVVLYKNIFQ